MGRPVYGLCNDREQIVLSRDLFKVGHTDAISVLIGKTFIKWQSMFDEFREHPAPGPPRGHQSNARVCSIS